MSVFAYLKRLVGNNPKTSILIGLFIIILCWLFFRPVAAAEVDVRGGASFGHSTGPVLGLQAYFPVGNAVDVFAGTLLWGKTATEDNNWDWHGGVRACRGNFCGSLGASWLQNEDRLNGAHTNFYLELSYTLPWKRVNSIDVVHLSDAGTSPVNLGRQAALVSFRLQ